MVGHIDKYNTQKEDKLKQDKLVLQNAEKTFLSFSTDPLFSVTPTSYSF